jgi:hypothetical protein
MEIETSAQDPRRHHMAGFAGALAAAIPVIEKVVAAIWPDPTRAKKKDAAEKTVATQKSESGDALKKVGDELTTVADLLEQCLPAEDGIVVIKAVLEANKGGVLTREDKLTIDIALDAVKKIADITQETKKAVRTITDEFTKRTFLKVIEAKTSGIDEALKALNLNVLAVEVDKLYVILNDVNQVAAQVVGGIAQGLGTASAEQKKPAPAKDLAGG